MRSIVVAAAVCFMMPSAHGYGKFAALVPNGKNVPNVPAIGHVDPSGGGDRNAFGKDFASNGMTWTTALCKLDSDGDGATNGEELGDPCCTWKSGATLALSITPTSPGTKNTFTAAQLSALKCQTGSSNSSTNSTTGSPSITTVPSTGSKSSPSTDVTSSPSSTTAAPKAASSASSAVVSAAVVTLGAALALQ
ncbi:hypothetical protein THRCLA_05133 [Thraustotheca clavata]|uniref:Secreted protein n=1 Tax=Thraustotheca clavata TaxID=74557 RepID=A0A0A7CLW5_9STRA|nr:secreted protein [Thraustotheca clavata]OQS02486.1 hypothetical protein THRCLA_05133 [Thraustotheca clavata]